MERWRHPELNLNTAGRSPVQAFGVLIQRKARPGSQIMPSPHAQGCPLQSRARNAPACGCHGLVGECTGIGRRLIDAPLCPINGPLPTKKAWPMPTHCQPMGGSIVPAPFGLCPNSTEIPGSAGPCCLFCLALTSSLPVCSLPCLSHPPPHSSCSHFPSGPASKRLTATGLSAPSPSPCPNTTPPQPSHDFILLDITLAQPGLCNGRSSPP